MDFKEIEGLKDYKEKEDLKDFKETEVLLVRVEIKDLKGNKDQQV